MDKTLSFLMFILLAQFAFGQAPWDEQQPSIIDYSTNGYHATYTNQLKILEDTPSNIVDKYSLQLTTTNSIFFPTNSNLYPTNQISISLWVKMTNPRSAVYDTFINHDYASSGLFSSRMGLADRRVSFRLVLNEVMTTISTTNTREYFNYRWSHFVGTYDGSSMKLYADGIMEKSSNCTGAITYTTTYNTNRCWKSGYDGSTWDLNGQLSNIQIYNRALTSNEVASIHATGNPIANGLQGFWKMNGDEPVNYYVSHSGSDENTGLSWEQAVIDLQRLVQTRTLPKKYNIFIDSGEWQMTNSYLNIAANSMSLKGNNPTCITNWTTITVNTNPVDAYDTSWVTGPPLPSEEYSTDELDRTIISGCGSNRVIMINASNVVLDSIAITGGYSTVLYTHGVGVSAQSNSIITNCIISGNTTTTNAYGGGIYRGSIYNSIISSNMTGGNATYGGGGCFSNDIKDSIITYNTVYGNADGFSGGGTKYCNIFNSLIMSNKTESPTFYGLGAGIANGMASNCLIIKNSELSMKYDRYSGGGGGSTYAILFNSIISSNTTYTNKGAGVSIGGIYNSIVSYNKCLTQLSETWGGGVYSTSISNSIIHNNETLFGRGGGIFNGLYPHYGYAYNCLIYSNVAKYGGGTSANGTNLVIRNNTATSQGGGGYYGTIYNSDIYSNSAYDGGGLYYGDIKNTRIYNNYATRYGGGLCSASAINCTIENNECGDTGGAGYRTYDLTGCLIKNNISPNDAISSDRNLINNTIINNTSAIPLISVAENYKAINNIIYDNSNNFIEAQRSLEQNWFWNPKFLTSSTYKLGPDSECIERGDNTYMDLLTDYYGRGRIYNVYVDLGMAEWWPEDTPMETASKKKALLMWFQKEHLK